MVLIAIASGIVAGVMAGLMGVGGGLVTIPAMVFLMGISQHTAQGTSLLVIIPTALVGLYGYHIKGRVNYSFGIQMAMGAVLGSVLSAFLVGYIPQGDLKKIFGAFAIIIATKIFKDVLSKQN